MYLPSTLDGFPSAIARCIAIKFASNVASSQFDIPNTLLIVNSSGCDFNGVEEDNMLISSSTLSDTVSKKEN